MITIAMASRTITTYIPETQTMTTIAMVSVEEGQKQCNTTSLSPTTVKLCKGIVMAASLRHSQNDYQG